MRIILDKISKRFDSGWVFRNIDFNLESGSRLAIKGPNGSGKSTLLSIISAYLSPSEGSVRYHHNKELIDRDRLYRLLAMSAAYGELDEELDASELFKHYSVFKNYQVKNPGEFLEIADLMQDSDKAVKYYSSGMKQRLALSLTICMDTPLLILDEPGSFLDVNRKNWYRNMINRFCENRTVIIASNDENDFVECNRVLDLSNS